MDIVIFFRAVNLGRSRVSNGARIARETSVGLGAIGAYQTTGIPLARAASPVALSALAEETVTLDPPSEPFTPEDRLFLGGSSVIFWHCNRRLSETTFTASAFRPVAPVRVVRKLSTLGPMDTKLNA